MKTQPILRAMTLLVTALALAAGLWGVMPVPQATAATCTSAGSGNWNEISWSGCTPGNGDDVIIGSEHTVTVNVDTATLNSLTVNGILRFDNSGTGKSMTVTGNVVIESGGRFDVATDGSDTTHSLTIGGDLTNDGVFDGLPDAGRIINVTFNRDGNQTISGAGTTRFNTLTVNMGTSRDNILDVQAVISLHASTNPLVIQNGTFRLSSASTITPFSGNRSIGPTAGLYLNHSGAVSSWGTSGSLTLNGLLTVAAGTMNVGSASGNEMAVTGTGANLTVSGGTLNVTGRIRAVSSGQVYISGGQIVVPTVGQSLGTQASFYMQPSGQLSMSGGTVILVRANGNPAGGDLRIESGAGSKTITGGTFQIGNASTPADQTIQVSSAIPIWNLTTAGVNSPTALLVAALTVNNNLTIGNETTLDANNLSIQVGGNWTNNSTFTPGTGTVTFNGSSSQSINGTTAFYNFTLNNAAGVSLGQVQTIAGQLTLASGQLMLGSNNLALGAAASIGGSPGVSAMVVTNGAGALCKTYNAASSFTFPVGDNTDTAEYSPATASFSSIAEAGTICVRVVDSVHDANPSATDYLSRYWEVNEADSFGSFDCTLTFAYTDDDVVGSAEQNMYGLKYDAGATGQKWTRFTQVDANANTFQVTVDSFSDFTAGDFTPTAITLASFEATPQDAAILVTWETASELDNAGFNLYRSETADGPYTQRNATLIPPQFPGEVIGGAYEWLDTDVLPGIVYYYKLEDLDVKGVSTFHGPVSTAVVTAPTAIHVQSVAARAGLLPLVTAGIVGMLGFVMTRRRRRQCSL